MIVIFIVLELLVVSPVLVFLRETDILTLFMSLYICDLFVISQWTEGVC